MSKVWRRSSDGKFIKDADGKILICDECPCGGCEGYADTYLIDLRFQGITTSGTLTLHDPAQTCFGNYLIDTINSECWWFASLPGGLELGRKAFLWISTINRGLPAEWTVTWGRRQFNPPSNCEGVNGDWVKNPHVLYSTTIPLGTYDIDGTGLNSAFAIIS